MNNSRGFTLIELLIASSLLTLIMFVGFYGYSLFADKWDKQLGNVEQTVQQVTALNLLDQLLDGIVPLALFDGNQEGFYFIGLADELTAVSLNGIRGGEKPVVFKIQVRNESDGTKSLWYKESSLDNVLVLTINQEIDFEYERLLINSAQSVEFSYFGWESFDLKASANFQNDLTGNGLRWFNSFMGWQRKIHPQAIRFKLSLETGTVELRSQFTENSEVLMRTVEGG